MTYLKNEGAIRDAVRKIVVDAHRGVKDKCGDPYINHPLAVAERVSALGLFYEMAAELHDVVEDSLFELSDLRSAGIPEDIVVAVDILTHVNKEKDPEKGMFYFDYIRYIRDCGNDIAFEVKLADLAENMREDRKFEPLNKWEGLQKRYKKSVDILNREVE